MKMCLQMGNFRGSVMSSCIKPLVQLHDKSPVVLLHCFDRYFIFFTDSIIIFMNSLCLNFNFVGILLGF